MTFIPGDNHKRDPTNSRNFPLGIGESHVGDWVDLRGISHFTVLYFTDVDFASISLQYSEDGISVVSDPLLGNIPLTATFDGLFHTYIANQSTPLYRFVRINVTGGIAAQTLFGSHFWLQKDPYPGSYGRPDDDLGQVSLALLTRGIVAGNVVDGLGQQTGVFDNATLSPSGSFNVAQPSVELFRYATPDDPGIPTGATPTIDPILNTEPNVVDTGWLPATLFPAGSRVLLRTGFGEGTLKAFIANASDDQGNNAEGLLFALSDTAITNPAVNGADFFDRYVRVILVNDSGTNINNVTARVVGAQVPQPGVTSSLASTVFDFFPATLGKNVMMGKVPGTSIMKLVEITTNGFLNTSSEDFLREVSLGRVGGHSIEEIQGQSDAVGTLYEDVWYITGTLAQPGLASTVDISSTSVNDTLLGTGVRSVKLVGLDANYDPIEELVELNGITPVSTLSNFLRVFSMSGEEVGALGASSGIVTGIHGDTFLPIIRMKSGVLNSAKSQFTIPSGKVGILVEEEVNSTVGDSAEFRLQVREFGSGAYQTTRVQLVGGGAITRQVTATSNVFPPKSDVRWQARKVGVGTTLATVNYSIMLIDEELV